MSDAGRYRRVHNNEWLDPAFRRLDAAHRVVRLYASAGPQTTSVGCFRFSTAMAVEELGGTPEEFESCLTNVCEAFGWGWDPVARVLWISDWFERNPPANKNVVAAWVKLIKNVPNSEVKTRAIVSINDSLKTLYPGFLQPWTELLKSFRKAESKAESQAERQAEPPQGAGIVGTGTESRRAPRGSAGSDGNGADRAIGSEGAPLTKIEELARRTLGIMRPIGLMEPDENLIDSFFATAKHAGGDDWRDWRRQDVVAALADALSKRVAS
ncbi:MAG: hypothetical protein LAO77_24195 [Acidobacteriia bacterium]|nr:hypothetical protein [Terriglobia bacterium]